MRITNRSAHALEAMVLMARGDLSKPKTLQSISEAIGISASYAEMIFARLRNADLVRSERGPGGGYYLNKPTGRIAAADIVAAFEEPNSIARPRRINLSSEPAVPERAAMELLWQTLNSRMERALANISLADLVILTTPTHGIEAYGEARPESLTSCTRVKNGDGI